MSTSTSRKRRFPTTIVRLIALILALLVLLVLVYVISVFIGFRSTAQTSGTRTEPQLTAAVQIFRDSRGIPHIRAADDHDLFFAQGYVEASDRLFQMDLLRRYVYGELSEIIGPPALAADENARIVDIRQIAYRQWQNLNARDRAVVEAYSDGVNAAMREQPLPVEFHALLYKPQPWQPQDCLAVGMATALDLIDPWSDVIRRDTVARQAGIALADDLYSITDPAYDAPVTSAAVARVAKLSARGVRAGLALPERPPIGSNEWAAGAQHSLTGHALLANDPHLRLQIPGVWYLIDLKSPALHVAGGSLAGTPGVILGHNDKIAWGATNGTVVTEVVYRDSLHGATVRRERFHVRFGRDAYADYYRTRHGFAVQTQGNTAYAVDWNADRKPATALSAFEGLDRAQSITQALKALAAYPGPPQNFVLADSQGNAAYQLAGLIPDDPTWGMRVHSGSDPFYGYVPFGKLPHVAPSHSAIVFTANNRMYGAGYPYRLSAQFDPPYRARRIDDLLHGKARFSVSDFENIQFDTLSLPERDLANDLLDAIRRKHLDADESLKPYVAAVRQWDGRFSPDSTGAPIVREVAKIASQRLADRNSGAAQTTYRSSGRPTIAVNTQMVLLMRVLRERPRGWWPQDDYDDLLAGSLQIAVRTYGAKLLRTWGQYDPIPVKHPLSALGFAFLNGVTLPGNGDSYVIHVQNDRDTQSFRAVWDVGDWDAGTFSVPMGESGRPASGHYKDQSAAWLAERPIAFPFSDAAVRAAAVETLTLSP